MNKSSIKTKPLFQHLTGLCVLAGVLAIIMGLVYITNLPGLTSDATGSTLLWGWLVLLNGMFALWLALRGNQGHGSNKAGIRIRLGLMFLMQLPPILLWFLYHGQVISDGPVGPVGNWLWSLPHITLAVASAYAIYQLFSTSTT
ncbi:hypothetical protein SY88_18895 [Clostridiales bacterium PH28_bin88]|nr:hypothetical protein SY88_18895 [Clostridiales bacterium PH28_bin88]